MKMLWLALLFVSPAYAQFTFDYQSPVFTSGVYAGESVTGEVVLFEPALYPGLGQEYVPQSETFSIGGQPLQNLSLVQVYFQQNGGILQNFDLKIGNEVTLISVSGSLQDTGIYRGTTSVTSRTTGVGSSIEAPGVWAPPGVKTVAAPEIDPSSAVAGLTLLLGVLAVLRGRRPRVSAPIPALG